MPERTSIFSISLELTSLKTCKVKLGFSCKLDRCPHQRLGSGNASVFMQKLTDVLAKCVLLCFAKSFIERERERERERDESVLSKSLFRQEFSQCRGIFQTCKCPTRKSCIALQWYLISLSVFGTKTYFYLLNTPLAVAWFFLFTKLKSC